MAVSEVDHRSKQYRGVSVQCKRSLKPTCIEMQVSLMVYNWTRRSAATRAAHATRLYSLAAGLEQACLSTNLYKCDI